MLQEIMIYVYDMICFLCMLEGYVLFCLYITEDTIML